MNRQRHTYDKSEDTRIEVVVGTFVGVYSLFFIIYMWIN